MGCLDKMDKNRVRLQNNCQIAFFMADRGHENAGEISLVGYMRVPPTRLDSEQDCACDAPDIHAFSAAPNRSMILDAEPAQFQAATGFSDNDCC